MLDVQLPALSFQPVRSTELEVLLRSSIHSSFEDVAVPIQAISLMTTVEIGDSSGRFDGIGVGVGEGVDDGVGVGVGLGVADRVGVGDGVGVEDEPPPPPPPLE